MKLKVCSGYRYSLFDSFNTPSPLADEIGTIALDDKRFWGDSYSHLQFTV